MIIYIMNKPLCSFMLSEGPLHILEGATASTSGMIIPCTGIQVPSQKVRTETLPYRCQNVGSSHPVGHGRSLDLASSRSAWQALGAGGPGLECFEHGESHLGLGQVGPPPRTTLQRH